MNTDPGRYFDPGTLGKVPRNTSVDPGNKFLQNMDEETFGLLHLRIYFFLSTPTVPRPNFQAQILVRPMNHRHHRQIPQNQQLVNCLLDLELAVPHPM
jgi:hypothetical protein